MNIKFTSKVSMTSKGITFQDGVIYDIAEEAKRLVKTFPNRFQLVQEATPQEVKPEIKEPTPVLDTKPEAVEPETKPKAVAKPKPKTSNRRTKSKED